MRSSQSSSSYRQMLTLQFRRNRAAVAALMLIIGMIGVALAADLIANDKPLAMSYHGEMYFPVLKDYAVWLGISDWDPQFQNVVYKEFAMEHFRNGDWAQFPPIPYSPNEVS